MKTIKLLLCLMLITSVSLIAQKKGEMPLTSSSPNGNKLLRQAWVAYADAKMDQGNDYVTQALNEDPAFGMAYVWSPTADPEERLENIRKAETMNLSAEERLFINGLKASRENKSAREYFSPLMKKYPRDEYLHLVIMFIAHNHESAIEIGENLIKRNPKFAPAYNLLGYGYMNRNELTKAEANFDKYISLRPDLANPYDSKGDFMMRIGKAEEAILLYEKAASMGMNTSADKAEVAGGTLKFPKASDDDIASIRTIIPASIAAYTKGDATAVLKDYSEHAVKIWGNQIALVGLSGVRQGVSNLLKNARYRKFEGPIRFVDGVGPIALAFGTIDSESHLPGEYSKPGHQENVVYLLRKNNDGNWKILADHFYAVEPDDQQLSPADRQSIERLISSWNNALLSGKVTDEQTLEAFSRTYSAQAIEIFGNQNSNIGLPNLQARWQNFLGATMEINSLGDATIEGLGRRAVAWGIARQSFSRKDSKDLEKYQFPWAMILTKEKDDVWRILVIHWGG